MKLVPVDLWRFTGTCVNGHSFVTHDFPDFHYGDGVIRTLDQHDLALVRTIDDPTFEEVGDIVEELMTAAGKKRYIDCFHQVFGIACDPAPSGQRYNFEKVHCPVCGSTELISYGPGEPPQVDTMELPHVTYDAWQQLSHDEKRERLRMALRERECLD